MNDVLPRLYLARHGETEWSASGRHTGRTDVPLTPKGQQNARQLGTRLKDANFSAALTSPLKRARSTCELAGFGQRAVVIPDLIEWDYGRFEGLRTSQIVQEHPGWNLFRDGCPGGETADQVGARADRVIAQIRKTVGDVILFSHGHFLRVLAARWLDLAPVEGRRFLLGTAALSILGYEHTISEPVVISWNVARDQISNS